MKRPKISKRVRAAAAMALDNKACSEFIGALNDFTEDPDARMLSAAAWQAVFDDVAFGVPTDLWRVVPAEAAQMLRDGWCPGDPVVLRHRFRVPTT